MGMIVEFQDFIIDCLKCIPYIGVNVLIVAAMMWWDSL